MTQLVTMGKSVRWFSIGAGILCLLLAAWRCPYVMGLKKTSGVIRSIHEDRDESGKPVMMVSVTYTRYRSHETWEVGGSFPLDALPSGCKVGDRVTLFFEPNSKNEWLASRIWIWPTVAGGLGCLLILAGLVAPRRKCGGDTPPLHLFPVTEVYFRLRAGPK